MIWGGFCSSPEFILAIYFNTSWGGIVFLVIDLVLVVFIFPDGVQGIDRGIDVGTTEADCVRGVDRGIDVYTSEVEWLREADWDNDVGISEVEWLREADWGNDEGTSEVVDFKGSSCSDDSMDDSGDDKDSSGGGDSTLRQL